MDSLARTYFEIPENINKDKTMNYDAIILNGKSSAKEHSIEKHFDKFISVIEKMQL